MRFGNHPYKLVWSRSGDFAIWGKEKKKKKSREETCFEFFIFRVIGFGFQNWGEILVEIFGYE